MWVQSLDQEDPLEKEIATHSSILAWKIPWMSESSRGMRVNIAWIDSRIDEEFFRVVVLPTLCVWNGPRYYEFYNAKE